MNNIELKIMKCETRIRKLKTKPVENEKLIKKAERNLRKYKSMV